MSVIRHNPDGVYPPYRNYSHAVEVSDARMLFISGLNGYASDGKTMAATFEAQCEQIWQHLGTILRDADMHYRDIVSLRVYLASPDDRAANTQLRVKYLGDHQPSLTVICSQLLDPAWKLEMEAVAAK